MNNKSKIIIINGMAQSGKDAFVKIASKHHRVMNISSIDPYRNIPYQLGFEDGNKGEEYRYFLSELKKLTKSINNYHINWILDKVKSSDDELIFVHIREPKEIEEFVNLTNAKTLLIINPRTYNITSNTSDKSVFDYNYDYTIINDGTLEELEKKFFRLFEVNNE